MAMKTAPPATAKFAVDGRDDGIETGKQAARREQIGQQIDAAPRRIARRILGRILGDSCIDFRGVGVSGVTAGIIGESLT